jgi:predicted CoA-binding protein
VHASRHYGSYQYTTLKNILRRGLDLVPVTPKLTSTVLVAPRFARTIDEIFHRNEVTP